MLQLTDEELHQVVGAQESLLLKLNGRLGILVLAHQDINLSWELQVVKEKIDLCAGIIAKAQRELQERKDQRDRK